MKRVDAILTADWHLRTTQPSMRQDDYLQSQIDKIDQIAQLQEQYDCPVIHAGDLFHTWDVPSYLISLLLDHIPNKFFTVYGNHDLPNHNLSLRKKSALFLLQKIGALSVLRSTHWQMEPKAKTIFPGMLVWHKFVYQGRMPWPGCKEMSCQELMTKYEEYRTIVTGHNHKPIAVRSGSQILINPGSIMRMTLDQKNHRPRVYFWNEKYNDFQPHFLQCKKGVFKRIQQLQDAEDNEHLQAFIHHLENQSDLAPDFKQNVWNYIRQHKVPERVRAIIEELFTD